MVLGCGDSFTGGRIMACARKSLPLSIRCDMKGSPPAPIKVCGVFGIFGSIFGFDSAVLATNSLLGFVIMNYTCQKRSLF